MRVPEWWLASLSAVFHLRLSDSAWSPEQATVNAMAAIIAVRKIIDLISFLSNSRDCQHE